MSMRIFRKSVAVFTFAAVLAGTLGPVAPASAAIADGANAQNVLGQATFGAKVNAVSESGMYGPENVLADHVNNRLYVSDANNNRAMVFDVASITDNENAVNVLGQSDLFDNATTTTQTSVTTPKGFALDTGNNRLYVMDSGNRRATVFDVASVTDNESAVNLLGQFDADNASSVEPDYTKGAAHGLPHRVTMGEVHGLAIDSVNDRFYVADYHGHRVLVYALNANDTFVDYVPDFVLGQPSFDGISSAATQAGLKNPRGLAIDTAGNRLFVADSGNNRVIVYDVASITNGENAVNVLGQANFTTATSATTQAGLNTPKDVAYDASNNRLFVPNGNRVIVYEVASITNGENAVNVLGQTNFTNSGAAASATGMNNPNGVHYDSASSSLIVADSSNNRVTFYDTSSISDGASAVNVLGQGDFTTSSAGVTQAGLSFPNAVTRHGTRLFVSDYSANRVMVFDITVVTDGENAESVLGQTDFTTSTGSISQSKFFQLASLEHDPTNNVLFVGNGEGVMGRVSHFDAVSITTGENATAQLGQFDEDSGSYPFATNPKHNGGFSSAQTRIHRLGFDAPQNAAIDTVNHRLFVVDKGSNTNRRVLVYDLNSDNTLTDRVPDYVLGNTSFRNYSSGTGAANFVTPEGIAIDTANNRLFVSDSGANRISVFNVASVTSGMSAVNVLGQVLFGTTTAATTQAGLSAPKGLAYDSVGQRLFVADSGNHRVAVYDVASITNGENAVNVLGQANFTTGTSALTQSGMNGPRGVGYHANQCKLFVADTGNNRVLAFDAAPSGGCVPLTTATVSTTSGSGGATSLRPPFVEISAVTPPGGAVKAGAIHGIFWTATGGAVVKYRLSLSIDGGTTYRRVKEGTDPFSGYFAWKTPNIAVRSAKLKIELLDVGGNALYTTVTDAFRIMPVKKPRLPERIIERLRVLFGAGR